MWCNINTHQALKPPYVFEMGDGTKLQIGLPYRIEYTVYSEELKDLVFEYWKKPEESGGHLSVNVDADTGKVTSVSYEMEPLVHHW